MVRESVEEKCGEMGNAEMWERGNVRTHHSLQTRFSQDEPLMYQTVQQLCGIFNYRDVWYFGEFLIWRGGSVGVFSKSGRGTAEAKAKAEAERGTAVKAPAWHTRKTNLVQRRGPCLVLLSRMEPLIGDLDGVSYQ